MLPILALVVACSAGVPTGVDTASNPADAPIIVNPRSLILEANQVSVFKAYATGVPGDSLVTSIEWTATGGTIALNGTYSSSSTGDFKVVGKRHGPTKTTSDTATVTVVQPQPTITSVVVTPSSGSVTTNTQQMFSATGKLSDGSTVAIGVTWTATGGSIDAGGVYTAGSTAGSYHVIAQAASANVADTVPVTVTAPAPWPSGSGSHPHEPAGMTAVTSRGWNAVGNDNCVGMAGNGALGDGGPAAWRDYGSGPNCNYFLTTQPDRSGTVGAFKYPAGAGTGTSVYNGGNPFVASSNYTGTHTIYRSIWFKISPNAIGHDIEWKFTFNKVDGGQNIYSAFYGSGGSTTGTITMGLGLQNIYNPSGAWGGVSYTGSGAHIFYTGAAVARGAWHQLEQLYYSGTAGHMDGTADVWLDGAHIISATQIGFVAPGGAGLLNGSNITGTWGGGPTLIPADQFLYFDDDYTSGK